MAITREQVLEAFGVTEAEIEALPDTDLMRQARIEREHFVTVELPDRWAVIEAEASASLTDAEPSPSDD